MMKLRVTWALGVGMVAAGCFRSAFAVTDTAGSDANPYAVISDRNVFHLNPPPAPLTAAEKPLDLPKVMLSGFRTVGGNTRVFMVLQPKDPKELVKFLDLAPGERNGSVELVKINSEKREVDIINSGSHMTLSFASNGVVALAAPAPVHGAGGAPPPMPGPLPGHRASLPNMPQAMPSVPMASATGSSAIIIGGGGGSDASSSYGSPTVSGGGGSTSFASASYNGPTVTGGSQGNVAQNPAPTMVNEAGVPIANSLLSPSGQYRMPPLVPSLPPVVQAAALMAHAAAGGPPAPPGIEDGPPSPDQ